MSPAGSCRDCEKHHSSLPCQVLPATPASPAAQLSGPIHTAQRLDCIQPHENIKSSASEAKAGEEGLPSACSILFSQHPLHLGPHSVFVALSPHHCSHLALASSVLSEFAMSTPNTVSVPHRSTCTMEATSRPHHHPHPASFTGSTLLPQG